MWKSAWHFAIIFQRIGIQILNCTCWMMKPANLETGVLYSSSLILNSFLMSIRALLLPLTLSWPNLFLFLTRFVAKTPDIWSDIKIWANQFRGRIIITTWTLTLLTSMDSMFLTAPSASAGQASLLSERLVLVFQRLKFSFWD